MAAFWQIATLDWVYLARLISQFSEDCLLSFLLWQSTSAALCVISTGPPL